MPETETAAALTDALTKLRAHRITELQKLLQLGFSPNLPDHLPAELRPALTALQQDGALFCRCQLAAPAAADDTAQAGFCAFTLIIALLPEVQNGALQLFVVDEGINELYTGFLHGSGAFNAALRERMLQIVTEIYAKASRPACFALPQQQRLAAYAKEHFQAEPEFLWPDSPESAVLRHQVTRKWFAVLLEPKARVIGLEGPGSVPLVNLHLDEELVQQLLTEGYPFLPAYHMNKTYWLSVRLGCIEDDRLFALLEQSFAKAR